MKICGLYWITRANGQLAPKSLKQPPSTSPVAINNRQILGIPSLDRWPVINMIQATMPTPDGEDEIPITLAQQNSLFAYRSPYTHSISSMGLQAGLGGYTRLFLLANHIFRRHAFGTPLYTFKTFFKNIVLELGDFVSLTHPLVLDLKSGILGLTNVLCEVISRQPDYAQGNITLKLMDTRFASISSGAYQIASSGAGIPVWGSASPAQRAQYMFISNNSGVMSDSSPGNQIL